jgi:hypothetical protein
MAALVNGSGPVQPEKSVVAVKDPAVGRVLPSVSIMFAPAGVPKILPLASSKVVFVV